ncbi:unnamed protein product [Prunus armeniaca]|uniref:Uncharacterized protein n=1 Tax=Prunus armeniaca TaxID=36596 RepID=A0A6J5TIT7_PRUAR|nr:unnamed protein product [Prunus armeniaca]
MSTETTVASVPADDQPIEGKVREEITHASKEIESLPSKDDGKKDEKEDLVVVAEKSDGSESQLISSMSEETPENNQTEHPIVVEGQVDHVPVEAGAKEVQSSDQDPEASTTKNSASEAVESQADESLTIENVPVEKVESVENTPVEKVATEAVEEEAEKAQTVEVDEDKPVEIVGIEEAEKEAEKAETIEAAENKPVEEVAIEEAEEEAEKAETIEAAENKTVEEVATEEAEKEEEKSETIEAAENKPVEEVAIEEAEKEAEKAETIEADENKLVETIETAAVEKEAEQTQAMEAEENKSVDKQIDDEKPKVEASEADPSTEAAGQAVEETLETSLVKDSEPVNEVEGKPHEQLKVLLEMERNIEKVLKPEENVATESSIPAIEEAQANEKVSHVAENTEKEAGVVDEVGKLLKDETEVSENAAVEEENIVKTEQEKTEEKIEKTEAKKTEDDNKLENVAEVADRELGEAKEVLVKEDVYKDIKENEEVVPSAIVEPVGEAKAVDDASKLENTEETANESKTEPETLEASKDQEKQDVSVKAAQKQSGGIISKVKQSIVKVKKAIIGKSPSSKVLSPEVKAEEPVK